MRTFSGLLIGAVVVLLACYLGAPIFAAEAAAPAPAPAAANPASGDARIKDLISNAGYAYHLGDYNRTLVLADQVLAIDPKNAGGLELKRMAAEALAKRAGLSWNDLKQAEQDRLLDDVRRGMVPGPIAPAGVPEGFRRARPGDESVVMGPARQLTRENAAILAKLEKTANVEFKETSLAQVAQFISTMGDVNVVIDPKAAIGEVKAADTTVTFTARDIKLVNVLKWVCRSTGLRFTVRDQVVFITTVEGLEPLKVTAVYDISDLIAPIPDYDSDVYFNMNLGAISVGQLFQWYSRYPYWYYQDGRNGIGLPFVGPFAAGADAIDRPHLTQPQIEEMIERLIENEEGK